MTDMPMTIPDPHAAMRAACHLKQILAQIYTCFRDVDGTHALSIDG